MRNLKRALSLALASVMLLGMMVVGTSAASYPDVDENDNIEAIEVLNAVKVMIGEQGNFNPDSPVNRHQMAVIMAKLVLGNEIADKYVGTHPFTDVAPWADKYVAACYENGIVAGTSKTTFGGDQPLTAVHAAAFMLRALGYKDLSKGASDWSVPVTAMANQIRLFSGVASNPKEQLTRNQVARLALNTLKSPVVDLKDNTFTATDGDGKLIISGGNREYIVRSSSEAYAKAINSTEVAGTSASQISGYTIELGEHLYNGKLKLNTNAQDDFGRPSNNWQYDGKDIGTFVNYDLRVGEYKTGVTGATMFELLTYTTINDNALLTYVDGVNSGITKSQLVRSNKNDLAYTGNGVLTEVFVDLEHKEVTITSINTYLAKANSDYNKANETLSLKVFASSWVGTTKPVDVKDVPQVADVAKDDYKLVYMSGKDNGASSPTDYSRFTVVDMFDVEVLTESTITKWSDVTHKDSDPVGTIYKVVDKLTTGGSEYKSNPKAYFNDTNVLENYNLQLLTDNTYNIYLDRYGNVIGVDLFEGTKNYVFITGYNGGNSYISIKTADAGAIFMDGTMKTITVNVEDTNKNIGNAAPAADYYAYTKWSANGDVDHNRWYTYTTASNGNYTLQPVKNFFYSNYDGTDGSTTTESTPVTLNSANLSLTDSNKIASPTYEKKDRIYGNDDSVYITVEAGRVSNSCTDVDAANPADFTKNHDVVYDAAVGPTLAGLKDAIVDVAGVYTGAQNVKIDLLPSVKQEINHEKTTGAATSNEQGAYVYSVYNNNGYIIASIVMGEAQGASANYIYTLSGVKAEWVEKGSTRANDSDTYFWEFDAVANGEKTTLTVKSKWANAISPLKPFTVQEVRYDGDYITKISDVNPTKAVYNNAISTDKKDVYDIGNDYGADYKWNNGNTGYMDNNEADTDADRISGTIQLVGRTLYTERAGGDDRGLALATDAKAVLIQPENGKREVTNCGSVDEAVGRLADRVDTQDGIQFQGRIVAALDSNGVAKWVVIISDTNLRTGSDPGYTQNASIKLNTTTGVASLSDLSLSTTTQYVEPASTYTMILDDGYTASKNASSTGGSVRLANADTNRWTITAPAKGGALVIDIAEAPDVVTEDITILEANARMLGGKDLTINKAWAPSDLGDNALEIPEGSTLTVLAFDTSDNAKDQTITGEGTLKVTGTLKIKNTDVITAKVEARDMHIVASDATGIGFTENVTVERNLIIDSNASNHAIDVKIGDTTGTDTATMAVKGTVKKGAVGTGARSITINKGSTLTVGDVKNPTTGTVIDTVAITNLSSSTLNAYGILKDVNLTVGDASNKGTNNIVGMVGGTLTLVNGTVTVTKSLQPTTVVKSSVDDVTITIPAGAAVSSAVVQGITGTEKTTGTFATKPASGSSAETFSKTEAATTPDSSEVKAAAAPDVSAAGTMPTAVDAITLVEKNDEAGKLAGMLDSNNKLTGFTSKEAYVGDDAAKKAAMEYADKMIAWKKAVMAEIAKNPGVYSIDETITRAFNWEQIEKDVHTKDWYSKGYVASDGTVWVNGYMLDDGTNGTKAGNNRVVFASDETRTGWVIAKLSDASGKEVWSRRGTVGGSPWVADGSKVESGTRTPILDNGTQYTWELIFVGGTEYVPGSYDTGEVIASGVFKWTTYEGYSAS